MLVGLFILALEGNYASLRRYFYVRKFSLIILLLASLLTGCGQKVKEASIESKDLVLGKTIFYENIENMPPSIITKFGGQEKIICKWDENPSEPIISPDKKRVAYITPYEFEVIGEVHIYSTTNSVKENAIKVADVPKDFKPMKLFWLNDRYLLIIIGYAYGTTSIGGDLYVYDTSNKKLSLLITEGDDQRQVKAVTSKNGDIIIEIAVYNDEFTGYVIEDKVYKSQSLIDLIK